MSRRPLTVTIHQPEHLPWLGFFHKAAQVDVFVLLDTVQYRHKYFQNRNRIRSHPGSCWVTVPVLLKGRGRPTIRDVRINPSGYRWREKCWRSISFNYQKARFFEAHAEFFQGVYSRPWELLVDLNVELLRYLFRVLGITASIVRASALEASGTGPELILKIAQELGADCYLSGISGIAGRGTAPEELFQRRGIAVQYQAFHHPIYRQLHEPFLPCMSAVDLLFNYGPQAADILRGEDAPRLQELVR